MILALRKRTQVASLSALFILEMIPSVAMRRFVTLALSFVGLFDAVYLWWVYASPSHPMACLGTGCDVVRASAYAHVWGVPTPVYGVAMYATLAILAFAEVMAGRILAAVIRTLILLLAAAGLVVSAILTSIEAFKLHAFCDWCLLSAIVVTLILIVSALGMRRAAPPPEGIAALQMVRAQFVLFIIAVIVGLVVFWHLSHSGEFAAAQRVNAATLEARLVRPDSPATGNLASPVTVVEFGDFDCPFCKLTQTSVQQLLKQYGSQIKFVFRQFPMDLLNPNMHPEAEKAAEASECAAAQGKFWQADPLFYQNQPNLAVPALEKYAAQLGLNTSQFDQCLSSGQMAARVRRDFEDGRAVGVNGTPTFFVNGREMLAPTYAQLSQAVDAALARTGLTTAQAGNAKARSTQAASAENSGVKSTASGNGAAAPAASIPSLNAGNPFSQVAQSNPLACSAQDASLAQPTLIHTAAAQKIYESRPKPVFVDIRSADEYAAGHIAGAISIPIEEIQQQWSSLPRNRMLVFYQANQGGSGEDVCAFSRAAARVLLLHGYDPSRVKVYEDGLDGWKKSGLPVAK